MNAVASARSLAAAFLCAALLPPLAFAAAQDADAIDGCHQGILKGLAAVTRGRIAIVGRCLKDGRYDSCPENDNHGIAHENELRNWVAGEASDCRAALDAGSTIADFGPPACADSWEDCDTEIPAIDTLENLAECLVCQERGFDFFLRDQIGLPRPEPSDIDERRCTRRLTRLVNNTIRKVIFDTASCARGGEKPFDCPVDVTTESRFGKALSTFAKNVAFCGIDEGRAPGALANLCHGSATDAATLTACFEGLAKCVACHTASNALGQSADCAAFSAHPDCDGSF